MNEDASREAIPDSSPDRVYSGLGVAEASARKRLGDPEATDEERCSALATLGRAAYYDNRIDDAVSYLDAALAFEPEASTQADLLLILAPALSKLGRGEEALRRLDALADTVSAQQKATALNQAGAVLVELGRLGDAISEFEAAAALYQEVGDVGGEGRALLNVGAAASEIGDLRRAEACTERAWRLNSSAGQELMCAMIEGNLGYLHSRRGDFATALEWFERGRRSFERLGEADLPLAVLETDLARMLLDIGLDEAALAAAEAARSMSVAGQNQLQEAHAQLLVGEARLRLGQRSEAELPLEAAERLANDLSLRPVALRARFLRAQSSSDDSDDAPTVNACMGLAAELRTAGWAREAVRCLLHGAGLRQRAGDRAGAIELLRVALDIGGEGSEDVDALDLITARAELASLTKNDQALRAEVVRAGLELERQRELFSTVEMYARLGRRLHRLEELEVRRAVEQEDAARLLSAQDRFATQRSIDRRHRRRSVAERERVRAMRVGLQEARLSDLSFAEAAAELRRAEDSLLATGVSALGGLASEDSPTLGSDWFLLDIVRVGDRIMCVSGQTELQIRDLASSVEVEGLVRRQRLGLRRLASGEAEARALVVDVGERLSSLLLEPVAVPDGVPIGIIDDRATTGVIWSAVGDLHSRPFTLAPSVRSLSQPFASTLVGSVAAVSGPRLIEADDEVRSVAALWSQVSTQTEKTTIEEAIEVVQSCDLLHVAAHGEFRSDNPFLSSIELHDGSLTLEAFEAFQSVPAVVVLATCDAARASFVGDQLVGTAHALLSLGVDVVFGASSTIDDEAAARLSVDLHDGLASGLAMIDAEVRARSLALERADAVDVAAALTHSIHGGSRTLGPIGLST